MASPRAHLRPLNPPAVAIAEGVKNANSEANPKAKQTKGRRKIPIRKIENKNKKHVTFSKRRKGLFTKASELCVLCGASVAVITFSEAGKVFSFGHPSPDAVIHRYLHGTVPSFSPPPPISTSVDPHTKQEETQQGDRLFWWDRPVEDLGFEELEAFAGSLDQMKSNVQMRIADIDFDQSKGLAIGPVKIEFNNNNNNNYCNMNMGVGGGVADFLCLPPPGGEVLHHLQQQQQQNQEYFQQCGCGCSTVGDDEGIGSIVAMADINRFGHGYGEF